MRKQYDGLHALVAQQMQKDVLCGDHPLLVGRDRRRAKVPLWVLTAGRAVPLREAARAGLLRRALDSRRRWRGGADDE